ncbi:DNA gyrase subunit A [Anaerotignum lactatifermentans]|uniref:DNA gyrase subunit A n=1 Tax=Anaerotignum lactatifermentans DSM 14214 TaxID=1121323 RepID=A0A1M6L450_9FIRM|nr:DNA gyrase subunit A [Anaerotignum lactatifermentans]SHJ65966.1 DNA gyrase subunit A [[Clostridium] lactatifermentans DSM 14214] [Anaerotignum lactatifermentans DSM 14214]
MSEVNNEMDKVVSIDINEEMKKCYIDYAMSVIVARALPDVRDGLKPVQRRILYSMNEMNLEPNKPYKKSARITGDTMGKYHPHGDSSIYQAMVRMAQNFSMRYMLVDGHGNFGSIDGYGAAAARYTEARMSKVAAAMLADIEKDTVDFAPNYDETEKEPVVLPARIPNLLVNGSSGIAVGMATNIPPHNLGEVIDGLTVMIDNKINGKETDVEELMEYIKGPDFPTGATILGKSGIRAAYRTGRGKILVRSTAEIQPMGNGREKIVVTEIPYMVNKLRLIEKIAELVKEKRVDGISDLYDASAGDDIQIIIELKKDVNANVILNQLYKYTQLQESFGAIMIALVNGKPAVLNLQQMLAEYLKHQEEVVTRRTKFNLDKAEKRAHILEGLRIAISNIDEVIRIIRTSYDDAKERLMERFGLSEIQAQAILEMQLRRLQGLEHEKIDAEYKDLQEKIAYYKSLLADEAKLLGVIRDEMQDIKNKYADPRRTQLVANPGEIDVEDLIDEETCVFTLSNLNYVKRTPLMTYKSQNRGGRGIVGMQTRDEDFVKDLFLCSTHDTILFFTDHGRVYRLKGYEVPEAGRTARGMAIVNLLEIAPDESVTAVIPVKEFREDRYLVMLTKQGLIKKTDMASYSNIRKGGLIAINLREDDSLISVMTTEGEDEILAATRNGMGIRFSEKDVRPMGRTATGVKAISLREGDYLVSAVKMSPTAKVLNVTEKGFGKRTVPEEFKVQYRGGMGVKIHQLTEKTGLLTGVLMLEENEEVMLITSEGVIIRLRGADISTIGRVSQGVKLMNLDEGVSVVGIAKITEDDIESEEEELAELAEKEAEAAAENEEITVSEDTEA